MGVAEIATLIRLLPEFLKFAKTANKKLKDGATLNEIKKALNHVDRAFNETDEKKAVDELNQVWSGRNLH